MTLREWLQEKPFALTMTSGFFGFFAHTGVLLVMEEEGLLPIRVSGSSAGALVTGCWSGGMKATDLADQLFALQKKDFWDPKWGWGWLEGKLFQEKLREMIPASTLEECRVPTSFSAFELGSWKTKVLEDGDLASAIHASCAFPFLFHPVKRQGKRYLDGGILDRSGLAGMPQEERVFCHHLNSSSPWRFSKSKAVQIPQRDHLVSFVIESLPRVSPNHLERGKRALEQTQKAFRQALDLEIHDKKVWVP